jgi:Mlc titration factor MtfA (ptsG expression regulator)
MMHSWSQWLQKGWQHWTKRQPPPPASSSQLRELDRWVWQAAWLGDSTRDLMVHWSEAFIRKKNWEGCEGFVVTEEVKKCIALNASLLVLAYPDFVFQSTQTILIYPRPYRARVRGGETHSGLGGEFYRAGETRARGPITLNWRDIESTIHNPNNGHHIVLHEFSHQLDMINDPNADGLPPLPKNIQPDRWHGEFQREFSVARDQVARGEAMVMDDYGLTHPSEFFAVATETYFQLPQELREYHPRVYQLLRDFYITDLALRMDGS